MSPEKWGQSDPHHYFEGISVTSLNFVQLTTSVSNNLDNSQLFVFETGLFTLVKEDSYYSLFQ